ncbi:putative T7SS-secreted protein [Streptomyces enissocaesilis]|uniref:Putative T7SS secretion signal domain-containing protein n=1 Tax=Streptomyces enissocaesilis TaxID=332589 RepID=A0ABN3XDQ8_9ACTN
MSATYPSLGFDPAPGDAGNVGSLAARTKQAATALDNAQATIKRLTGNVSWAGDAASAFSRKVGELPGYLKDSHEAMRTASTELSKWREALTHYQSTARTYETHAREAKGKVASAEKANEAAIGRYNQAAADPAFRLGGQYFTGPALQEAQAKVDAANARLKQADGELSSASAQLDRAQRELEEIIKRAEQLLENHQAEARGIAGQLRKATDSAPDPGFWDRLGDKFQEIGHAIQEWCARHKDLLNKIGDWLGNISAVLGILALLTLWCPPLSGALALASAGFSAGALLSHGAAKLGGADVSWLSLAGDAVGIIPGAAFAKTAITGTVKVVKVGNVVDDAMHAARIADAGFTTVKGPAYKLFSNTERIGDVIASDGHRFKLAWEHSVAKNLGAGLVEKGLSQVVDRVPGLRSIDSFRSAIRADGSLDPTSWWSKGPLLAQSVPGAVSDIYDSVTGE